MARSKQLASSARNFIFGSVHAHQPHPHHHLDELLPDKWFLAVICPKRLDLIT